MKEKVFDVLPTLKGIKKNELKELIEVPKSSEMGDYSLPCFHLSRKLKKSPVVIAKEIANKIKISKNFEKIENNGGYVNFFFNRNMLARKIINEVDKKKNSFGKIKKKKRKVMIEFSQPNTHKAFHVGHVRGTCIGESLARILEFGGNKVIRANYSGDTGMHIAKWLWCYNKYHSKENLSDDESWIAGIYVDAVKRLKENPDLQEEVDKINKKLDSRKDKKLNEIWEESKRLSISSWKKIYEELNTRFDVQYFESDFERRGKEIIKKLVKMKIAKVSDGATIVDFKDFEEKELSVLVLLRKDGTVLYGGKDLALGEKKFKDYDLDKSIYVVGNSQNLYIHQMFNIFNKLDTKNSKKLVYVPVYEVRFPWGKMSSRSGDNILYSDFKKEIVEIVVSNMEGRGDLDASEIYNRAEAISNASIKYAMLKQDIEKNIIFDKESSMRFEGDTGPYLLYSYARALSVLRKANYNKNKKFEISGILDFEKRLISEMIKLPEIVDKAYENLAPNLIANYSYNLAKIFNEFYHKRPIIGTEGEQLRLKLVDSFSQVLKNALFLLGINVIEEM